MKKLYASKTFLKMAGGRMHSRISLILPSESAHGHKLQKPSRECGIFQSLGTINFVLFYQKTESKRGSHGPMPPAPTRASGDSSYPDLLRVLRLYQHNLL